MDGIDIFNQHQWHPLSFLGIDSSLAALDAETIIYTWVVLGIITIAALAGRISLQYPHSVPAYLAKKYVRTFMDLIKQSFDAVEYRYLMFVIALFTFLMVSNCLVIFPTMEEPTKNINSTVALSLIAFFYIQKESFKAHGALSYLNEYFKTPLPVFGRNKPVTPLFVVDSCMRIILNIIIGTLLLPIELLSKFSSVLSLSFRLFGNIFGGAVITSLVGYVKSGSLVWQIVCLISGLNLLLLLFFGIFEGLIQAFVFTVLSLTYLSMAVRPTHASEE